VAKSPEPPPAPALAPTEGPPMQAVGQQPSGNFICEMPNCGAVSICVVPGSERREGHTAVPSSKSSGLLADACHVATTFLLAWPRESGCMSSAKCDTACWGIEEGPKAKPSMAAQACHAQHSGGRGRGIETLRPACGT
jgi:hypothetical protein